MSLIKFTEVTDFRISLQCVLRLRFWDVMLYSSADNTYWYFGGITCHHHPGMRVPPWWHRQKTLPKHQALFTNYTASQPKRLYSLSQSYPTPTSKKKTSVVTDTSLPTCHWMDVDCLFNLFFTLPGPASTTVSANRSSWKFWGCNWNKSCVQKANHSFRLSGSGSLMKTVKFFLSYI